MNIIPAIDLLSGRVVRLSQGDYDKVTDYGGDPLAVARGFEAKGAKYLHVVDLDGAKNGAPVNDAVIASLVKGCGLSVELGGGIRDEQSVSRALGLGVARVILGTKALRDPAFVGRMVKAYGDQIAVGVDARDGFVAVDGWRTITDTRAFDFVLQLRDLGVHTIIYTDISRDGQLSGANIDAYRALRKVPCIRLIASGGVTGLADIIALRRVGADGCIIGKSLYAGAITLEDAISAAEGAC